MTIDALAFLPTPRAAGGSSPVAAVLGEMARFGIDRTILCAGGPSGDEGGEDAVLAAVAAHPDRLVALLRCNPTHPAWHNELQRRAGTGGVVGIFLHPFEDGYSVLDPRTVALVEAAGSIPLPVVVAAGYPWVAEPLQIGSLAERFRTTSFVLTNEGQLNISGLGTTDVSLLLGATANVYLHMTGAYREDFLATLLSRHGAQRLMYASQSPRFNRALELRRIEWLPGAPDAARQQMLAGTATTVFSLQ